MQGLAIGPGGIVYAATDLTHYYLPSEETGDRETYLSMVHRYDPSTRKTGRFLKGQNTGVSYLELSADGRWMLLVRMRPELSYRRGARNPFEYQQIYARPGSGVTVWNMATGEKLSTLTLSADSFDERTPGPIQSGWRDDPVPVRGPE